MLNSVAIHDTCICKNIVNDGATISSNRASPCYLPISVASVEYGHVVRRAEAFYDVTVGVLITITNHLTNTAVQVTHDESTLTLQLILARLGPYHIPKARDTSGVRPLRRGIHERNVQGLDATSYPHPAPTFVD